MCQMNKKKNPCLVTLVLVYIFLKFLQFNFCFCFCFFLAEINILHNLLGDKLAIVYMFYFQSFSGLIFFSHLFLIIIL